MQKTALVWATLLPTVFTLTALLGSSAVAHRDGCHRWHSCESDSGSYVCGDLGYDTYCDKRSSSVRAVPVPLPKPVYKPVPRLLPRLAPTPVAIVGNRIATLNDGPVKFRLRPSTQAQILSRLEKGTRVNLDACGLEWCAIRYGGKSGWMMKKFLRF